MTEIECAKYLKKYRDNPQCPLSYMYGCGYNKDREIQRFVDVMNKAIKICEKYGSRKNAEVVV